VPTIVQRALCRAGKFLRPLGCDIVTVDAARPFSWGLRPVLGSFPPFSEVNTIGARKNYFIHDGYQHRDEAINFIDTSEDEYQDEVYQFARENLTTVVDIGCGSGFKLVKYFRHLSTVGVDVPETCSWLRKRYPTRIWKEADCALNFGYEIDLVISSDVIEHLVNPDELLDTIDRIRPRYAILSTPDRNLLRVSTHNGPPLNSLHMREWSFSEFQAYIRDRFDLLEHFISCTPQCTQCVLCRPRLRHSDVVV
jgi:SAM-dependent methyltransferase